MGENNSQTKVAENKNDGSSAPATQHLRGTAHEVVDQAADRAEGVETKVREGSAHLAEKTKAGKAEVKQQLNGTLEKADDFIRQRPVTSVGIAFGAGVFAALLLKR